MMIMGFSSHLGHPLGDTGVPIVDSAVDYIKGQATTGAEAAIPTIKTAIQPYIVAALLLGLLGAMFGMAAFISTKRKQKARIA